MCHRIRWGMMQSPIRGDCIRYREADETYIGRREAGKTWHAERRRWHRETPVLALVERGGNVHSFPLERITSKR